jgi:hypothetical protein
VIADILGTKHTRHKRNGLEEGEDALCRMCGDALETDSHVLWECAHPVLATARMALCKKVRSKWREAGLGMGELVVANLLWRLDERGTALCRSASEVGTALRDSDARRCALLENALLGHTLDTTGLYSDRAGLFGEGWLTLLGELGLSRADAMNALVEVANALQGAAGTLSIWKAFTCVLEVSDRTVAGEPREQVSYSTSFREWAAETRARLRQDGIEDDEPYRLLASAGAMGMASGDMANFACMVQDWSDTMEGGGAEAVDALAWATDLTDAIQGAGEAVANDRHQRGCTIITARNTAREDAKAKALDRRRLLLRDPAQDHDAMSRERLKKSIAKLRPKQQRIGTRGGRAKQPKKSDCEAARAATERGDDSRVAMSDAREASREKARGRVEAEDIRPEARSLRKRRTPAQGAEGQASNRARTDSADGRQDNDRRQNRTADAPTRTPILLIEPAARRPGLRSSKKRRADESGTAEERANTKRTTATRRPVTGATKRAATTTAVQHTDRSKRARTREERATGTAIREPD